VARRSDVAWQGEAVQPNLLGRWLGVNGNTSVGLCCVELQAGELVSAGLCLVCSLSWKPTLVA